MSISTVEIPVLGYVKKVILKEFGPEPIRITQQGALGKSILAMPLDLPADDFHLTAVGEKIKLEVSVRLSLHFKKYNDLFQAGYFYEKMVQRMLIQHIHAQFRLGVPAWRAMEDFYTLYNIGEDDYSMDAAYFIWKEYKRETLKGEAENAHKNLRSLRCPIDEDRAVLSSRQNALPIAVAQ